MQIGPLQLEWWHLLIIGVLMIAAGWFIWGVLVRVTGTWERVDEDAKKNAELITLAQFGPFVRGRRKMKGGFQEYSGYLRGRSIEMIRRDHGKQMIMDQGFPEGVADEVDGSVTARMRLTLSADGSVIHGTFCPQKIEFTHNPPKVTKRYFLEPSFRRYKLVSRQPLQSEVVSKPAKANASPKFRRTV